VSIILGVRAFRLGEGDSERRKPSSQPASEKTSQRERGHWGVLTNSEYALKSATSASVSFLVWKIPPICVHPAKARQTRSCKADFWGTVHFCWIDRCFLLVKVKKGSATLNNAELAVDIVQCRWNETNQSFFATLLREEWSVPNGVFLWRA